MVGFDRFEVTRMTLLADGAYVVTRLAIHQSLVNPARWTDVILAVLSKPTRVTEASKIKLNTLGKRQIAAEIDRAGHATHVVLPCIGARFPSATCFLFSTKSSADFRTRWSNVHIHNAAI